MKSRLKIGSKIILITVPITMIAVILAAVISGYSSRTALEKAAFARLTAVRELKAQQIEGYFDLVSNQVAMIASTPSVSEAFTDLGYALAPFPTIADSTIDENTAEVTSYYSEDFGPRLKETRMPGVDDVLISSFVPGDPVALLIQSKLLADQNSETNDQASFSWNYFLNLQTKLDGEFKEFTNRFEIKSIFLVLAQDERVAYSTNRGIELGTSLTNGPHRDSNLGKVALAATKVEAGETVFSDFEKYLPALGRPTAFVAAPVFGSSERTGTVIFEISVDTINDIMTSHQLWQDVGLGVSGETYLVGEDLLLRSQSRFLIEDRERYLEMIREIGTPEDIVRQIESQSNSIGLQQVDTIGTRAALAGETDTQIFPDYRGVDVLSAFRPLNIRRINWVIMSEIDKSEALADFQKLRDLLIVLASVILAGAVFTAYYFALSLTRPIRTLAGMAKNLSSGNLDDSVEVQTGDEIGDLARDFEIMRSSMKDAFAKVEEQKAHLEEEVRKQTDELAETSGQLNSALSSMQNGIHMLDKDLNFILSNDKYLEHLSLPPNLVEPGTPVVKSVQFRARRGDFGAWTQERAIRQAMEEYTDQSIQRVERPLDNGRTIEFRLTHLSNGEKVVVTSDITELKNKEIDLLAKNEEMELIQGELKGSEQRIAKVIQSSPDGIITIDKKGVILSFSASAERTFGYFSDEVIGRNIMILMPKEIAIEHDYYLEKYILGEPSTIVGDNRTVDARRKDGSVFKMDLRVEVIELGDGEVMFIGTTRDITIQLQMEAEVNKAREDAMAANAAKSAFLANMSHELRTPMNAIIGYSEMLAEDAEDDGLDDMLGDLQKITAAGKHLLSLINDVLDLSKIEAGKMELFIEAFNFSDVANEVADTAQSLVKTNGNTLAVEIGAGLENLDGDLTKTRQMLFNLISNAAKFTENGAITLAGEKYENRGSDWVRFSISDTGIGIPADKLDKIFQEFSQADDSTTRNYGGTGLGLSLTRRFAQMMGGDIRVESEVGSGSSFIIEIPMKVTKQREGLEAEASMDETDDNTAIATVKTSPYHLLSTLERVHKEKPLVLVVDDDQSARELLTRSLELEGCEVKAARDGKEGLKMAADLSPDLITLDIMMPGMDGWTVLRKIKADKNLKDIPVLMVSMIGDRGMSYELGAVDSIQKPIDRKKLRGFVEKYAQGKNNSVLIVEDDPAARANIRSSLEKADWSVTEAENGAIGLEAVENKKFDLVLLDLMMPVMDGFEFLHKLRDSNSPSAGTPVIVITAKDLDAKDRARLTGNVDEIIAKSGRSIVQIIEEVKVALGDAWTSNGAKPL
ncbi:response regulator [Falsihalocynthiibacter arcticus]|uniref:response regulator n=1 Tax=Falsihalocynthiibacter arcticus TaxID=1579316 RepID=UPI0030013EDB